ncbi:MAG: hypothetical protein IKJ01_08410, partial [Lachnospiraceae bacterium]|nr:hypothetical protein [Lachnospiraceae bacterium]
MQMDIDRLCLENAIDRFLKSGKKEDAFDVYFCYLEMFVGNYKHTRRMIELLSEFEANGSGLLMKHRDHYVHSVYVFILGLAIYQTNSIYRATYNKTYNLTDEHKAAHHYLQYWGMTSLFHDIGYPFELPFEQVASYFEVDGEQREKRPFVAYHALDSFVKIDKSMARQIAHMYGDKQEAIFETTDELFAYVLSQKLSETYLFSQEQMLRFLKEKPTQPNKFNHYMDHAYFSATVLFKKLFCEMGCPLHLEHIDALTAILMHNSLYKFCIAYYKNEKLNIPFEAQKHPLAYMLMLCDELQCWDRTAYGRNSKKELHPMGCEFVFENDVIKATYIFDNKQEAKIKAYEAKYEAWKVQKPQSDDKEVMALWKKQKPKLKAYSGMYEKNAQGVCDLQEDIESIVNLSKIKLDINMKLSEKTYTKNRSYLSDSNFINLYHFAVVLNGRWNVMDDWKKAKEENNEEAFIFDKKREKEFSEAFEKISLEYKLSNIGQAKAFASYLDKIDCFYTDKSVDFALVEQFSEEELMKMGIFEHQRWLQEHYYNCWTYGEPEKTQRDFLRQHRDMIPEFEISQGDVTEEVAQKNYERLDKGEQDKDT